MGASIAWYGSSCQAPNTNNVDTAELRQLETPSGTGWIQLLDVLELPPKTSAPCYFSGPIASDTNTDRGDRGAASAASVPRK